LAAAVEAVAASESIHDELVAVVEVAAVDDADVGSKNNAEAANVTFVSEAAEEGSSCSERTSSGSVCENLGSYLLLPAFGRQD